MQDKIHLGIIGFGRIVELVHLPLIKKLSNIKISGIYDITEKRRKLAVKRGFSVYENLDELLNSNINAVLIATPPSSHFSLAEQALHHDKHVLIEKPVTVNYQEAKQLEMLSYKKERVVSIFQNRRYDSDFLLVKNVISSGILGDPLFIERVHSAYDDGSKFAVKSFYPQWRKEQEFGGGALLDWGVHLIDQVFQLDVGTLNKTNSMIRSLGLEDKEVDDFVRADFLSDRGVQVMIEVNFRNHAQKPLWVVGGKEKTLIVHMNQEVEVFERGKKVDFMFDEHFTSPIDIYSSFSDEILGRGKADVSIDEGVRVMEIIDQILVDAKALVIS
jgi:scyllo-inositol 2-dehydrogenase (NADP+)